jgi:hypothetical protein
MDPCVLIWLTERYRGCLQENSRCCKSAAAEGRHVILGAKPRDHITARLNGSTVPRHVLRKAYDNYGLAAQISC